MSTSAARTIPRCTNRSPRSARAILWVNSTEEMMLGILTHSSSHRHPISPPRPLLHILVGADAAVAAATVVLLMVPCSVTVVVLVCMRCYVVSVSSAVVATIIPTWGVWCRGEVWGVEIPRSAVKITRWRLKVWWRLLPVVLVLTLMLQLLLLLLFLRKVVMGMLLRTISPGSCACSMLRLFAPSTTSRIAGPGMRGNMVEYD